MSITLPLLSCAICIIVIWYCFDVIDHVDKEHEDAQADANIDYVNQLLKEIK